MTLLSDGEIVLNGEFYRCLGHGNLSKIESSDRTPFGLHVYCLLHSGSLHLIPFSFKNATDKLMLIAKC
jgi:alpha-acetolactate decarboxylase